MCEVLSPVGSSQQPAISLSFSVSVGSFHVLSILVVCLCFLLLGKMEFDENSLISDSGI